MLDRIGDELGAGVHVQLQHHPGLVVLNRLGCEMKMRGYFFGGLPLRQETENLTLLRF